MYSQDAIQFDALLLPLLEATDEAESQRLFAKLISEHADTVIKEIIKYKLRLSLVHSDAEDVYGEILLQILAELREFKKSPKNRPIKDFKSYVATIAYHTCYEYLREKYPQRSRLKDRLRYLLSHHKSFAMWEGNQEKF